MSTRASFATDVVRHKRNATDPYIEYFAAGDRVIRLRVREGGTVLDTVRLVPQVVAPLDPVTCSSGPVEAEDGVLSGTVTARDFGGASGGVAVLAPNRAGNNSDSNASPDYVNVRIIVATSGMYKIETQSRASNGRDDSWWVQVNDSDPDRWNVSRATSFLTRDVAFQGSVDPLLLTLEAGDHTIRFIQREDGTVLDTVALVAR